MNTPDAFTLDHDGKPIRVIMREGEPWYVVSDVCRALSLYMTGDKPRAIAAMRRLRPSAKALYPVETSRGPRLVGIVNRDGLSDLAFWAKRPDGPEPFVWEINEAMVSGRYENVAA